MALIGYARVSTEEQDTSGQRDTLRAEGCSVIIEDKASGGSRERPNLAQSARSCDFGHVEEQRLNMAIYQARSCPPIS